MVTTAIYLALLATRQVTLRSLWDLTNYFPPPLVLACPDLATESALELTCKNFTLVVHLAMHKSGSLQSVQNTALDNANWYTATFQPKMKNYHKGHLV